MLVSLSLVGCGMNKEASTITHHEIYDELLERFHKDWDKYMDKEFVHPYHLILKVGKPTLASAGECKYFDYSNERVITIAERYLEDERLYTLFLHEIGHCVFNLKHTEENQSPLLMYPNLPVHAWYEDREVRDFFKHLGGKDETVN